jgi:hypothetical protein
VPAHRLAAECMLIKDPSHAVAKRTTSESCSDMPCDCHFRQKSMDQLSDLLKLLPVSYC